MSDDLMSNLTTESQIMFMYLILKFVTFSSYIKVISREYLTEFQLNAFTYHLYIPNDKMSACLSRSLAIIKPKRQVPAIGTVVDNASCHLLKRRQICTRRYFEIQICIFQQSSCVDSAPDYSVVELDTYKYGLCYCPSNQGHIRLQDGHGHTMTDKAQ